VSCPVGYTAEKVEDGIAREIPSVLTPFTRQDTLSNSKSTRQETVKIPVGDSILTIQTEAMVTDCGKFVLPFVKTCYRVPIRITLEGSDATKSLIYDFLSEISDAVVDFRFDDSLGCLVTNDATSNAPSNAPTISQAPSESNDCNPCVLVEERVLAAECVESNPIIAEVIALNSSCGRDWDPFCIVVYNDCYKNACGPSQQDLIDIIASTGGPEGGPIDRDQIDRNCVPLTNKRGVSNGLRGVHSNLNNAQFPWTDLP